MKNYLQIYSLYNALHPHNSYDDFKKFLKFAKFENMSNEKLFDYLWIRLREYSFFSSWFDCSDPDCLLD